MCIDTLNTFIYEMERGILMSQFDTQYERRNTSSVKWDLMENIYSIPDASNIIPMWIADMDFASPAVITDALKKRLEFPLYAYTYENDVCANSVTTWLARRHGWVISNEDILYHHGVVPAIATIIETFTNTDDSVLVNSPIYPPFFNIPKKLGRQVVYSPLIEENGRYSFDFANFEQQVQREEVKIFILCHPHNPAGICWPEDVLKKIDALCYENDVLIISDEIHSDLVLNGKHIPLAKVSAHQENIITCFAPTKTFNIAGIHVAMMIAQDPKKYLKLKNNMMKHGLMGLNTFAITALEAAFSEEGEKWLHELIAYLNDNVSYVIDTITTAIPAIQIAKPDATYLIWLDIRGLDMEETTVMQKLLDAGVALDPGTKYGSQFDGFLRMNIACSKKTLVEATKRFITALS